MAINETNVQKLRAIDAGLNDFANLILAQLFNKLDGQFYKECEQAVCQAFIDKAELEEERKAVEEQVKADMLASGDKSYEGYGYRLNLMPGRVSWDGKKLDGYMVAHPEIAPFRKVGNPFVTIKDIES